MISLEDATQAVDEAWKHWKRKPSDATEAAYDAAYRQWKTLGTTRGVGRPASGDETGLTSSERAQATRARQQQAAARWDKVAPLIQQLRRSLVGNDNDALTAVANRLVRETAMALTGFQVIHAQPDADVVALHGWNGDQMVLAFVPTVHLDDYFRRAKRLTRKEANLLVDANLGAFARIISDKFERGEHRPYSRFGTTLPRVDVTLEDLTSGSAKLSASALEVADGFRWGVA
jgi:hypothetical protein